MKKERKTLEDLFGGPRSKRGRSQGKKKVVLLSIRIGIKFLAYCERAAVLFARKYYLPEATISAWQAWTLRFALVQGTALEKGFLELEEPKDQLLQLRCTVEFRMACRLAAGRNGMELTEWIRGHMVRSMKELGVNHV